MGWDAWTRRQQKDPFASFSPCQTSSHHNPLCLPVLVHKAARISRPDFRSEPSQITSKPHDPKHPSTRTFSGHSSSDFSTTQTTTASSHLFIPALSPVLESTRTPHPTNSPPFIRSKLQNVCPRQHLHEHPGLAPASRLHPVLLAVYAPAHQAPDGGRLAFVAPPRWLFPTLAGGAHHAQWYLSGISEQPQQC